MALELECRIIDKMGVQSGSSSRGVWAKQEMIVEFKDGNFPNKLCVSVWGQEKVNDLSHFNVGDEVKISFNLSSREFNGKWYTDVRVWKIESLSSARQANADRSNAATTGRASFPAANPAPVPTADDFSAPVDDDEDLPF